LNVINNRDGSLAEGRCLQAGGPGSPQNYKVSARKRIADRFCSQQNLDNLRSKEKLNFETNTITRGTNKWKKFRLKSARKPQ
jgi:hypothetical protein